MTANRSPIRIAPLVVVAVVWLAVACIVNLPYQYTAVWEVGDYNLNVGKDFQLEVEDRPVMAGFPYRFWIRYQTNDPRSVSHSGFALRPMLANLGLTSVWVLIWVIYLARRQRRLGVTKSRVSITDVLALTAVAVIPFVGWQRSQNAGRAHKEFVRELQAAGALVEHSAWVPKILADYMPPAMQRDMRRVRRVRLDAPTTKIVESLFSYPDLTLLRIDGGDYPLTLLQRLASNQHLTDLRISGRQLDAKSLAAIGSIPRLHTLSLTRTNVDRESLTSLGDVAQLRRLNLIDTNVELTEPIQPEWSAHLSVLCIGHQTASDGGKLSIRQWPHLKRLVVQEFDIEPDPRPFAVELVDLPELQRAELDRRRRFDLLIRDTPKLESVPILHLDWSLSSGDGPNSPGAPSIRRLDINNAKRLGKMGIYAAGIRYLRIQNTPQLRQFTVAPSYTVKDDVRHPLTLEPKIADALIDGLGASDGPDELDMSKVQIGKADLSPLTGNRRVTTLKLSGSGVRAKQLKQLTKMNWLRNLEIAECHLDDVTLGQLIDSLPQLEHLRFSPHSTLSRYAQAPGAIDQPFVLRKLRIVDRPQLRTLDTGDQDLFNLDHVEIVAAPQLDTELHLGALRYLRIEDAPKVSKLIVHADFPADASLSGIGGLQAFAAGGPGVTDRVLIDLSECEALTKLTLAYTAVTAKGLRQFRNLGRLVELNLPGAPLDDQIVAGWPELTSISKLDVSDTSITDDALKLLIAGPMVFRLRLDRIPVQPEQLAFLAQKRGLAELSVVGVGITASTLDKILERGDLKFLDLSDCEVGPELLEVLTRKGRLLEHLVLRNCTLAAPAMAALIKQHPKLVFELEGSEVHPALMAELIARGRLAERADWYDRQRLRYTMPSIGGDRMLRKILPALIDTDLFQPSEVSEVPGSAAADPEP